MSYTIINLTLPVVNQVLEDTLDTYPHYPYQQAFSIPDLRQALIAYVLCRIQNLYTVAEDEDAAIALAQRTSFSPDELLLIQALVHQGIEHVLQENAEWTEHHIPQTIHSVQSPSTWFG
jgi:hypothetical protein